jgi:hypothetical protein
MAYTLSVHTLAKAHDATHNVYGDAQRPEIESDDDKDRDEADEFGVISESTHGVVPVLLRTQEQSNIASKKRWGHPGCMESLLAMIGAGKKIGVRRKRRLGVGNVVSATDCVCIRKGVQ